MILFSLALYQRLTLTPNSPPHFMARLIADGPGRDYLRQACPTRHFALCQNLDTLPANPRTASSGATCPGCRPSKAR